MPGETATKIGHGLAKVLGIKLNYRDPLGANADPVTRGESVFSAGTEDTQAYLEPEPSSIEWIKEHTPTARQCLSYIINLFPFLSWIDRYNLQWLYGDLTAGITVGAVVVPQGMSYAQLAHMPVEYGMYTSFMGVLVYWIFATSKDITIGPVAVMSTIVGNIVETAGQSHPEYSAADIGRALSIIAGGIVAAMGFLRIGFIVDFIPVPAICAFMTGSSIKIISGQVKKLLGEPTKQVDTGGATYMAIINTLKHLPQAGIDSAVGVSCLFMLYFIRFVCNYCAKKYPRRQKIIFFAQTMRTVFALLFYTMISAAVNIHRRDNPRIKTLGTVPRGFRHVGVPILNKDIIKVFATQLPASVIVLLIEHIAISKSFGRVNNYTINPSQELVGIGVSNLLGPFLGAYPATGSFSRTAIQAKAGARTPLAGCITAIVVLLAIYALPALFWYIPSAALAAVIIHAVGDLITPPNTVYQFWRVSPLDTIIFFIGVIITIFTSIEDGIYATICISAAVLLFRVAKARGTFLGRVRIHSVVGDHLLDDEGRYGAADKKQHADGVDIKVDEEVGQVDELPDGGRSFRTIFLPLNHADGSNPLIEPEQPYPGIFIYRFSEGFNYPNCIHYTDQLVQTIFKHTRRTNPFTYRNPGERPWNDPGPRRGQEPDASPELPILKAVILDFSSVNNVDVTSVQTLIDVRNQLDLYASPEKVQWHFAHINNRWTKRALASAGFGFPTPKSGEGFQRWKPIFSVAELGGSTSPAAYAERENQERERQAFGHDLESGGQIVDPETKMPVEDITRYSHENPTSSASSVNRVDTLQKDENLHYEIADSGPYRNRRKMALVQGINRPYFHIDLTSALQSAIANAAGDPSISLGTVEPPQEVELQEQPRDPPQDPPKESPEELPRKQVEEAEIQEAPYPPYHQEEIQEEPYPPYHQEEIQEEPYPPCHQEIQEESYPPYHHEEIQEEPNPPYHPR